MRSLLPFLALLVAMPMGCDDDTKTAASSTVGAGGSTPAPMVTLSVLTRDPLMNAVDGVQVCIHERDDLPCDTTDADGRAKLSAPATGPLWVAFTKPGFANALFGLVLEGDDLMMTAPMINLALAGTIADAAEVTRDSSKGSIGVAAVVKSPPDYPGVAGVTFALTPDVGDGPYYGNSINLPDKSLTATGGRGAAVFFNVDPGSAEMVVHNPHGQCAAFRAHPGSTDDQFAVLIVPDFVTYLTVTCDAPAGGGGGGSGGGAAGGAGGA